MILLPDNVVSLFLYVYVVLQRSVNVFHPNFQVPQNSIDPLLLELGFNPTFNPVEIHNRNLVVFAEITH